MADDGQGHSLQFDRIDVKIPASVECRTLDALHWDCFATRRKKSIEIAEGDHICGDLGLGACMEPKSGVMLA